MIIKKYEKYPHKSTALSRNESSLSGRIIRVCYYCQQC